MTIPHPSIYAAPALYELAFSARDIGAQVDFLLTGFERRRGRTARSFLELAAGPAAHAIEVGSRGLDAAGLDLSPAMQAHALQRARARGVPLAYTLADMVSFTTERKFDLVATMLSSATYILTDEDLLTHFDSVADALSDDGMYVIELPHPSSLDGVQTVGDAWTESNEHGVLHARWDSEDPTQATTNCIARFEFRPHGGGAPILIEESAPERMFRHAELDQLVRRSGRFEVEATLGALDESVAWDAPKAWRMVVFLRLKRVKEES